MQKRIISISDISCVGRCSTTVALPIISTCGIECSILPTVLLSTHTAGFENYTYLNLNDEDLKILDHWKSLNLQYNAIYSGFAGNLKHLELILGLVKDKKVPYFCDPVLGDNGKLYDCFDDKYLEKIKELVKYADIITPNLTEARLLLNEDQNKNNSLDEIINFAKQLCSQGPKISIITGIDYNNKIGFIGYNSLTNTVIKFFHNKISQYVHGTGDVFASAFFGMYLKTGKIEKSLRTAGIFTYKSIQNTLKNNQDPKYGLAFEENLKILK